MSQCVYPKLNSYKKEFLLYFDQPVISGFDIIFQQLKNTFDCSYLSYALELGPSKRIHYFSNKEWETIFVTDKLIEHCPLLAFAQKTNSSLLEWNSLKGTMTKQQSRVMQARASFNIGNGIALRQLFYGMSEIITLASVKNNLHFSRYILNKLHILEQFILDIRLLSISNMITKGWIANKDAHTILNTMSIMKHNPHQLH